MAVTGGTSREMLTALAAQVLERAGSAAAAAALGEELYAAVVKGAASPPPIHVAFTAAAGRLHIVVSSRAGEIWQTFRDVA